MVSDKLHTKLIEAINIGDVNLVKQVIHDGVISKTLPIHAIQNLSSVKILELLLENGFEIFTDANKVFSQWMGSSATDYKLRSEKLDLLAFISSYYLEKPASIAKFKSSILDQKRLFRMGLESNNFDMMKFGVLIGADENEALNSVLNRYYNKQENINREILSEIIEYILSSIVAFKKITILNAVCFKYSEVLTALNNMDDLEYGYEMAYKYNNDDLCKYFISRGVSNQAQSFAKMKVSAVKGDIKELRKAVNEGADVKEIQSDTLVEIINKNQVKSLQYLYESGLPLDTSINQYLNESINYHKAYDSISYLTELGLDVSKIKHIPLEFKSSYPILYDMWEKRFRNIFDYTIYLVKEVYPQTDGKEKEKTLQRIAELSTLPYVVKRSQEVSI